LDEAILNTLNDLQGKSQNRNTKDQEALLGEQVTLHRLPACQRERVKIKISSLLLDAEFPEET
jgi:hypothetical protein